MPAVDPRGAGAELTIAKLNTYRRGRRVNQVPWHVSAVVFLRLDVDAARPRHDDRGS